MPSRWSDRRLNMRQILDGETCVHPGSVHDPMSARIAEDVGFELAMLAGSVASMAVLGAPDHIVLTLTEFSDLAHRINRGTNLPLMVDADHGYGNALNVMRTVEELETAGVSGMSIEDTSLPTPYASNAASLISIEEGVAKCRAALQARCDSTLVIAGRTSVRAADSFDEVLERSQAYEKTGVDAIFVVGVKSKDELEALSQATSVPLILGGAGDEIMDKDYLAANRVRICLQGHQPYAAAVQALRNTLEALRSGVPPVDLKGVASADLMKSMTHDAEYAKWIQSYLK